MVTDHFDRLPIKDIRTMRREARIMRGSPERKTAPHDEEDQGRDWEGRGAFEEPTAGFLALM